MGLVREHTGLVLANAKLELGAFTRRENELVMNTDGRGLIRLTSDQQVTHYIVAAPSGFARVDVASARLKKRIDLQPWGQVKGTIWWEGAPAKGQLLIRDGATWGMGLGYLDNRLITSVALSSDGTYHLPRVAPGTHVVQLRIGDQCQYLGDLTVPPGETVNFEYLPSLRPVSVRLNWPAKFRTAGMRRMAVLETQNLLA